MLTYGEYIAKCASKGLLTIFIYYLNAEIDVGIVTSVVSCEKGFAFDTNSYFANCSKPFDTIYR